MTWLKITFDPWAFGMAKVSAFPKKRPKTVCGQWVVFDKDFGYIPGTLRPSTVLFSASTCEECYAFIDELSCRYGK
jgi:hypothetical protein